MTISEKKSCNEEQVRKQYKGQKRERDQSDRTSLKGARTEENKKNMKGKCLEQTAD